MKKLLTFLLLLVTFSSVIFTAGCGSAPPIPNPGFRVKTRQRFNFYGFPIPFIRLPLPGLQIRLEKQRDIGTTTGSINRFPQTPPPAPIPDAVVTDINSRFDANQGVAPAEWKVTVPNNILVNNRLIRCAGQSATFSINPGTSYTFNCRRNLTLPFLATPSLIDVETQNATSVQIESTEGKSIFYGAPASALTVEYYKVDQNGDAQLVDTEPVSSVSADGTSVVIPNRFPREAIPALYTEYVVLLVDGSDDYIGTALVTVDNLPFPCPQPGGINQETCEGVFGRTWDPENCVCIF